MVQIENPEKHVRTLQVLLKLRQGPEVSTNRNGFGAVDARHYQMTGVGFDRGLSLFQG